MEKINVFQVIIALTGAHFTGAEVNPRYLEFLKTPEALIAVYKASKSHDIAHIVGAELDKLGILTDGDIAEKFHKQQMMAIFRYERIIYDQERFYEALENAQIEFIPLKGAVLRDYYPEPYMRTSCDIDILVHENELGKAMQVLTDAGFKTDERVGSHDVSFFSDTGTHLELHYTLYEKMNVEDIWKTSVIKEGKKYHKLMSRETFYCHQVAHAAKHFSSSGCGIRLFLDMWFLLEAEHYDRAEVERILSYGDLVTFEKNARTMTYAWFSHKPHTSLTENMQNYIFGSGIYGNTANKVAISNSRKGGKLKYIMSRIFMPYWQMCYYYPILKKHKILLPFLEIARWFRLLFGGKAKKSFYEIKQSTTISEDNQRYILNLLEKLDL